MDENTYCVLSCDEDGVEYCTKETTLHEAIKEMKKMHPAILIQVVRIRFDLAKYRNDIKTEINKLQEELESIE